MTSTSEGLFVADPDGNPVDWNPAALRLYGCSTVEQGRAHQITFEQTFVSFRPDGTVLSPAEWPMARVLRGETRTDCELRVRRSDSGLDLVISQSGAPVRGPDGRIERGVLTLHDVTERPRLEAGLRQARKMEVVGQPAGGVANNFNNLLTVISGFSELVLARLPADAPVRPLVDQVIAAADRAAGLTRLLLAFTHKSVLEPQVLDVSKVVADTERMLRRVIREDIHLVIQADAAAGAVRADRGQLAQVILNLVLNARDAMPRGGQITIDVRGADLDAAHAAAHVVAAPGPHVLLSVTDTGPGVTAEDVARVSQPMIATNDERGTGPELPSARPCPGSSRRTSPVGR